MIAHFSLCSFRITIAMCWRNPQTWRPMPVWLQHSPSLPSYARLWRKYTQRSQPGDCLISVPRAKRALKHAHVCDVLPLPQVLRLWYCGARVLGRMHDTRPGQWKWEGLLRAESAGVRGRPRHWHWHDWGPGAVHQNHSMEGWSISHSRYEMDQMKNSRMYNPVTKIVTVSWAIAFLCHPFFSI